MDLRQLNSFITITKLLSFTQAADSLGYAQSTITTQIKLLEEELGVRLFERISKNISLTPEGKKLLPYAKQILKLASEAKNLLSNSTIPSGSLTIGAAESLCVIRLPEILKEYRKLYPKVEVSVKFGNCIELRSFLRENTVDVAISLGSRIESEDFITEIELDEPMLLLTAPGHPLIDKESIFPGDLIDEPLILTETSCSYRAVFENILSRSSIKPNVVLESGSVHAIKQFTMAGLGVSLLPQVAVMEEVSAEKLIPLKWAGHDFGIVSQVLYHKDKWLSPALKAFLALTKEIMLK